MLDAVRVEVVDSVGLVCISVVIDAVVVVDFNEIGVVTIETGVPAPSPLISGTLVGLVVG